MQQEVLLSGKDFTRTGLFWLIATYKIRLTDKDFTAALLEVTGSTVTREQPARVVVTAGSATTRQSLADQLNALSPTWATFEILLPGAECCRIAAVAAVAQLATPFRFAPPVLSRTNGTWGSAALARPDLCCVNADGSDYVSETTGRTLVIISPGSTTLHVIVCQPGAEESGRFTVTQDGVCADGLGAAQYIPCKAHKSSNRSYAGIPNVAELRALVVPDDSAEIPGGPAPRCRGISAWMGGGTPPPPPLVDTLLHPSSGLLPRVTMAATNLNYLSDKNPDRVVTAVREVPAQWLRNITDFYLLLNAIDKAETPGPSWAKQSKARAHGALTQIVAGFQEGMERSLGPEWMAIPATFSERPV